jgi:indole-3-pyruvate monooxygenase
MTSSLPFVPFPENYPLFPSRQQVIDYLESYVKLMKINICCEHELNEAKFNQETKEWVLKLSTRGTTPVEYTAKYLIIATGQNARKRPVSPFLGQEEFGGVVLHASEYKSGEAFRDKKVLVVGFGNSGAEIAIDLWEHNATVSVVLRSPVNIVIRDEMAKNAWILPLVHYIPTWLLICLSKFFLPKRPHGDLSKYNVTTPRNDFTSIEGIVYGKQTPSIDIGQWDLVKRGEIKVYRGISRFTRSGVIVTEGKHIPLDAVIFATGYTHSLETFLPSELCQKLIDPTNPHHILYSGREIPFQENLWLIGFHDIVGRLFEINWEAKQIAERLFEKWKTQTSYQNVSVD